VFDWLANSSSAAGICEDSACLAACVKLACECAPDLSDWSGVERISYRSEKRCMWVKIQEYLTFGMGADLMGFALDIYSASFQGAVIEVPAPW
jgi:hypothetical protein